MLRSWPHVMWALVFLGLQRPLDPGLRGAAARRAVWRLVSRVLPERAAGDSAVAAVGSRTTGHAVPIASRPRSHRPPSGYTARASSRGRTWSVCSVRGRSGRQSHLRTRRRAGPWFRSAGGATPRLRRRRGRERPADCRSPGGCVSHLGERDSTADRECHPGRQRALRRGDRARRRPRRHLERAESARRSRGRLPP